MYHRRRHISQVHMMKCICMHVLYEEKAALLKKMSSPLRADINRGESEIIPLV